MTLPAKFYTTRQLYADTIAAITLMEPALAPTRAELPRELLGWDTELQRLLALVPLSLGRWEVLTRQAWQELDRGYMVELVERLADLKADKIFVWHRSWYIAKLRQLIEIEIRYNEARSRAQTLYLDAKQERYA